MINRYSNNRPNLTLTFTGHTFVVVRFSGNFGDFVFGAEKRFRIRGGRRIRAFPGTGDVFFSGDCVVGFSYPSATGG